ncbi:MAG: hypothetical protein DHS20C02_19140 [Micavibrio sp.]|nr:MAG: hypothetical protein DHS20C02_19140 [Micavibrio sp.]
MERRLGEHRSKQVEGFSKRYNLKKLVYYEHFLDIEAAIMREKEIKKWRRAKKNELVESLNLDWNDFSSLKGSSK